MINFRTARMVAQLLSDHPDHTNSISNIGQLLNFSHASNKNLQSKFLYTKLIYINYH